MTAAERLALINVRLPSLAAAACALSLVITLPLAAFLNIWQDEAYTLQTTSHGFAYAFHQSIAFEQNAPLYFLLIVLWRTVSSSVFFLRLFSVICAAIAVALVPALARRYLPKANPAFVTFAVAWNPFLIWAAVEMRVYALVVLFSVLLLLTFYDAFCSSKPSPLAAVAYGACVIAALYTQYYLAFFVAAQAVSLIVYHRKALAPFLLAAAAAAIAFAPMVLVVPAQVENFEGAFAAPATPLHSLAYLARILLRYVFPLLAAHATIIYVVLIVAAGAAAFLSRRRFVRSGDGLLPFTTICAIVLFALGAYIAKVHILNRHAAFLYVPCVLSIFAALTFLRAETARKAATVWFALVSVVSAVALAQTYAPRAKPGDWIRATAYLRAHDRPGQPILVFEAENALPLAYYYRGPNRIIAIPEGVDFRRYDVTHFVVHDEAQLRERIPRTKEIWFINAGDCASANIQFGCPIVERYLASHYRTEADRAFYGSRVRLLRLAE